MSARAVVCMAAVMVVGCAAPARVVTSVPVPVACQEQIPARPVMPTESLPEDASTHAFVVASQAEIERREGYELKLLAALQACIAPLRGGSDL